MSDISTETIASAIQRLQESDVIAIVRRNLPKWRVWFPSEQSSVETARADLLALVTLAEAYLEMAECPTRRAINTLGEAAKRLPQEWEIELRFVREEASLSLWSPNGIEIDVHHDGECAFLDAIDEAVEGAAEEGGDA